MGNVGCCKSDQEEKSSDVVPSHDVHPPTHDMQEDKISAEFEPVAFDASAPAAAHHALKSAVKEPGVQGNLKTFTITIDKRAGGKLGADVDFNESGSLVIVQIREGLFLTWNQEHPDKQVQLGDRIVSVNGHRGDVVHLVSEFQRGIELVIEVHHGPEPPPVWS
mmetsp:Transcript_42060/g.98664  ORF Transcript_42060/g.98664 Transcript_42060/m.98664 type:complete len:164 (+) Transcript_42060:127-618(+)